MLEEKKEFAKALGLRLAEVRTSMDSPLPVRQCDVEAAVGLNVNNVSNWETGSHPPPSFWLMKLCKFYGCSADYVLGLKPKRFSKQQKQLLAKIESLDDYEQEAVETLVDNLLARHQLSDG